MERSKRSRATCSRRWIAAGRRRCATSRRCCSGARRRAGLLRPSSASAFAGGRERARAGRGPRAAARCSSSSRRCACCCSRARGESWLSDRSHCCSVCRSDNSLRRMALRQVALERAQCAQVLGAVRHAAFGRARGRRCALVGDEVGDRDVGLVADAADDRNAARVDRARDGFLVERHQVLERAAAAGEDQHVAVARAHRRVAAPARFRAARLRPARPPGRPGPARPGSGAAGCAGCRAARRRSAT